MKYEVLHRLILGLSGVCAVAVGAAILVDPVSFHAENGIVIGRDASSLSEARAPGGVRLVRGAVMLAGVFRRGLTAAVTGIAALVYLAYGASRLIGMAMDGMAMDGMPASGLVTATVGEIVLGGANLVVVFSRGLRLPSVSGLPVA